MKSARERFNEHFQRNYANGVKVPQFKPYKPPKVLMEQYQRAHEYHRLPSLFGYEAK